LATTARRVLVGTAGVRAGWRVLAWFLIGPVALALCVNAALHLFLDFEEPEAWRPLTFILAESIGGLGILTTLAAAAIMARLERRRLRDYGLGRGVVGVRLWEGASWGAALAAALLAAIAVAGGARISGWALPGRALASSAVAWAVAMLLLGVAEEFVFRGYPLATLATGLGFWPASALMTAVFGALHYLGKPMETPLDGVTVTLLGLLLCLTLRRTGDLGFAIGFHAAFDWAALVLFASPNSGNMGRPVEGHLLSVEYGGPAWLTGGPCGIEASAIALPLILVMAWLFDRRYRDVRFPRSAEPREDDRR
jgi:membrane protease YdiL (CAAX protease family)